MLDFSLAVTTRPGWQFLSDPLVFKVVVAAAGLIVLVILVRIWQRLRWSAYLARRRRDTRKQQKEAERRHQELEQLTDRIVATSSTASIAGFEIVRQIEAVFTDGQASPNKAVEVLKALAAEKGANAVVNLGSARAVGGKCVAQGDAVVVRSVAGRRAGLPSVESDSTDPARPRGESGATP